MCVDKLIYAADPDDCGKDLAKLDRQSAVAELVLGEDAAQLGGTLIDRTWLGSVSSGKASGKLLVSQSIQLLLRRL